MNENDLRKIIGTNIKKYRLLYNKENQKMTKRRLAELTELSLSHITNIESKKTNISIDSLYKIATVLEIPVSKLLEEKND